MIHVHHITLGLIILQIYVSAAPGATTELNDATTETNRKISDDSHSLKLDLQQNSLTQSQRKKRYFNFYGPGFPPINPTIYPSYHRWNQPLDTALYGVEDVFTQVQRYLQDVSQNRRQSIPHLPPVTFPVYFPVFYVPQSGCDCASNSNRGPTPRPQPRPQTPPPQPDQTPQPRPQSPPPQPDQTPQPEPQPTTTENQDGTMTENRISDGNGSENENGEEEEYSRPISFDPIIVDQPMLRPFPPVDHGTFEGDSQPPPSSGVPEEASYPFPAPQPAPSLPQPQPRPTTARPTTARPTPQPTTPRPAPQPQRPFSSDVLSNRIPSTTTFSPLFPPTKCDTAILTCCHRNPVQYSCFVEQGCREPPQQLTNPCDANVILGVIKKFQKFYGVITR